MRLLFKLGTSQNLTLAEASQFFEFEERRNRLQKVLERSQATVTETSAETTSPTTAAVADTNTTTTLATPEGVPDKKSKEPIPTEHI